MPRPFSASIRLTSELCHRRNYYASDSSALSTRKTLTVYRSVKYVHIERTWQLMPSVCKLYLLLAIYGFLSDTVSETCCTASKIGWLVNENRGTNRKEAVGTNSNYTYCPDIWLQVLSNTYKTTTVRTNGVPSGIRTGHLLNVTNITACL